MFVRRLNSDIGISGYFASRFSLYMKAKIIKPPTTRRAMIFAESQGNKTPPKSRANKIMMVQARKVKMPNQSMALMPSMKDVCSCRMSRKRRIRIAPNPLMGRLM